MSRTTPRVLIVTGLMASGKSSVAQAIAERLPMAVHLRGDVFRKMIVAGRVEITPEPSSEALDQLRLRYQLACNACVDYADAGFTVVYQDVILGDHLSEVASRLEHCSPGVVVLNPSPDVVAIRDAERTKSAYTESWTPATLGALLNDTPNIGLWLDTSQMSVAETVDYILTNPEQMQRRISAPESL